MIPKDKNTRVRKATSKIHDNNVKLLALIVKKGKRDTTGFMKLFGKYPDLPSVTTVRKSAWK